MFFPLGTRDLPSAPPLRRLIGPSFILLGLGLGSGELILWPYLTSNYGLGLVWAIVIGVTIQFFINMEVERYALIYGESIFVGFARWLRVLPFWFIITTFLGFGWPGIGFAGASLLSRSLGGIDPRWVAVASFIAVGLILSLGHQLYKTVETLQKYLILIGTPAILLLTLYLTRGTDWQALAGGLIGRGPGYSFLPPGIPLATFLGALAFSGAGGNLNLAQSYYVRDKGYGMGKFSPPLKSIFASRGRTEYSLTGNTFPLTAVNLTRFSRWWKAVNLEHFLIFWVLGLVTMLTLALLAYTTAFGRPDNPSGINFVLNEAKFIGQNTLPLLSPVFLIITGLMLTATQLTVLDSTSRIITENLLLARGAKAADVSRNYFLVLWGQIVFGIIVILSGLSQPRQLITISAVINALAMFVYIALILYLHHTRLPAPLRPSLLRTVVLITGFLFFGVLSFLTFTA